MCFHMSALSKRFGLCPQGCATIKLEALVKPTFALGSRPRVESET